MIQKELMLFFISETRSLLQDFIVRIRRSTNPNDWRLTRDTGWWATNGRTRLRTRLRTVYGRTSIVTYLYQTAAQPGG